MKKQALLFVSLMIVSLFAAAAPVDPATARKAAAHFLNSSGMKSEAYALNDISQFTPFSELYVFDIDGGKGFVVISGDDNTEPVLAYSLSNPFPTVVMPEHIRAWFKGYELEIRQNRNNAKSQSSKKQWSDLLAGRFSNGSKEIISSMLKTAWNQNPYYNEHCPYDSTARRYPPCGCTATATAQIMKAFNHPAQGYGEGSYTHYRYGYLSANYGATQYQWDTMPKKLSQYSTEAEVDAVAELIDNERDDEASHHEGYFSIVRKPTTDFIPQ